MVERKVDQDVAAEVELAEKGPGFERKVGEVVASPRRPAPLELADQDVLIERQDLGPESATFIAAGSPIPPELASLPRRSARAAPRKR